MPTNAEKAAEERAQETVTKGRFAANESDDNSILVSDEGFVGVDDMYRNAANETDAPAPFPAVDSVDDDDDFHKREADAARRVQQGISEITLDASTVGRRGYTTAVPHPSVARTPASGYIDANRTVTEAQAKQARETLGEPEAADVPRTVDGANSPQTDEAKAAAEETVAKAEEVQAAQVAKAEEAADKAASKP